MDISIIIVNYNVKHFLEQCLYSVEKALKKVDGEVFIVDNNSVDGSCQMVNEKFPQFTIIANHENLGFSKANNQAIKLAKGRYILLLNPDTFIQDDTLEKCVRFCDNHPEAGGLGVKMIDGKGHFLPESKRSLPTPLVAFFKIFGFSSLFPKSKIFGKYHLGFLDKDKTHAVDILCGAFMMLRKSLIDKIGMLDEAFFMYGEDIDLSYRIIREGYKNYYFADTTIIHYKGESTKKGSINYVMVFYKAMIIFANKHFSSKNAWLYSLLINLAIYFRASLGIISRIITRLFLPVFDFLLIYLGFYFFVPFWSQYKFGIHNYYPDYFFQFVVPVYILSWMFFIFISGGYDKKLVTTSLFKGVFFGTVWLLIIYALLPEGYRFSRALLVLGSLWTLSIVFLVRFSAILFFRKKYQFNVVPAKKRIAIIGSDSETKRVIGILNDSRISYEFSGRVVLSESDKDGNIIGHISQIEEILKINKIDELVFCSQDISANEIIEIMLSIRYLTADYKIAPPESVSVIGSNSINTAGDLYVIDINSLSKPVNKRKKRMFDMMSGAILLLLSPLLIFMVNQKPGFLKNCVMVLIGKYSWVGLELDKHFSMQHDDVKPGVLTPADGLKGENINPDIVHRTSIMYAKDYQVFNDILITFRGFRSLGRQIIFKS